MAALQESIHILGAGNIAKLFAHSLAKTYPGLPITLLFHRPSLVGEWEKSGKCIEIVTNGVADRQTGFKYEIISQSDGIKLETMKNLIITTKTYATVPALKPLRSRLNETSTLLFLQNGMGTMEEVTSSLFDQPSTRPYFLAGIVNHGVYTLGQFSAVHAGLASTTIGAFRPISTPPTIETPAVTSNYLAKLVRGSPRLAATLVSPDELLRVQLQKLAVNAVVNPLTVIFDCINGYLFERPLIKALMFALLTEISAIEQAIISSKSSTTPNPSLVSTVSYESLKEIVIDILGINVKNISSMRQDVMAGKKTEIDYINGYIVARGADFGIQCPLNQRVVDMVKAGIVISDSEIVDNFGI